MQMYYFFVLAMLAFAAPIVFGRRLPPEERPELIYDRPR